MSSIPALYVTVGALRADPALQAGRRGARKIVVTKLYSKECEAKDTVWHADPSQCPVQVMPDTELAVFTHLAAQDRHYHKEGTEVYMVISGTMLMEAGGVNYPLAAGEMLIVNPGTGHEVKPSGTEFMSCVITVKCKGDKDKYIVPPGITVRTDL
jgi:mannose-6-phosphate isomerase-like protein (cupin superfamily)